MEAAVVHPRLPGGDVTEMIEDAADDLVGAALTAEQLELIHHPIEREFHARQRVARVTVTLAVELMVTALEFLAIELREQGHTKRGVHGVISGVSERPFHSSEPRHRVSTGDLARPHPSRAGAGRSATSKSVSMCCHVRNGTSGGSSARLEADAGPVRWSTAPSAAGPAPGPFRQPPGAGRQRRTVQRWPAAALRPAGSMAHASAPGQSPLLPLAAESCTRKVSIRCCRPPAAAAPTRVATADRGTPITRAAAATFSNTGRIATSSRNSSRSRVGLPARLGLARHELALSGARPREVRRRPARTTW